MSNTTISATQTLLRPSLFSPDLDMSEHPDDILELRAHLKKHKQHNTRIPPPLLRRPFGLDIMMSSPPNPDAQALLTAIEDMAKNHTQDYTTFTKHILGADKILFAPPYDELRALIKHMNNAKSDEGRMMGAQMVQLVHFFISCQLSDRQTAEGLSGWVSKFSDALKEVEDECAQVTEEKERALAQVEALQIELEKVQQHVNVLKKDKRMIEQLRKEKEQALAKASILEHERDEARKNFDIAVASVENLKKESQDSQNRMGQSLGFIDVYVGNT